MENVILDPDMEKQEELKTRSSKGKALRYKWAKS